MKLTQVGADQMADEEIGNRSVNGSKNAHGHLMREAWALIAPIGTAIVPTYTDLVSAERLISCVYVQVS